MKKEGINLAKKNLEKRSSSSLDQTYSDLTPAESAHTHTWVLDILCTQKPPCLIPPFATVILSVEIGRQQLYPKSYIVSHGKSLGDLLRFMTHSFCCCCSLSPFVVASVFPLSSNKNGNFGLDHEQDDDAFFFLRNDAPL